VSQGFDEGVGRDAVVVEKTPGRLGDSEGVFDICVDGDTGACRLLNMSFDQVTIAGVEPFVQQIDFHTILPMLP